MAQNAPASQDVQDIQFKLHDKFNVFPESKEPKSLVSLLAVSSAKGLLFAGNPDGKELKVFKLKEVVDAKTTGQELKARVVNLNGEPKSLACSCDGSLLAVNYFHSNTGFLQIFQVDSFVSPKINSLYNLPVAPESNVFALQLLWNPVIANNIALILSDGSVAMFTLNNGGQYDKVTLGKEHQVKSGCWSPKGKQIVFGFAEGKLQQFKPNLQPARGIPCPPGIHPGPFDCIALHWLSTYQFAAIFLQRGQDMCPSLFIVNAPKAGQPSYINYYDICYSAPGPRIQQLSFTHIAQWNLLLVTSANGVEVGVLGTRETGENPNWIQYTLLDEARIEMPLTDAKDETYPMGFTYDTSAAHQIVVGEKRLPVMPMIHVLSTHGHMVSYNFLNLTPNAVDVCSPPPPLNDVSGQFKPLSETLVSAAPIGSNQLKAEANKTEQLASNKAQSAGEGYGDMTFTLGSNMVTSTPAIKDKPAPLFGGQVPAAKPIANVGFTANTVAAKATTATVNKPASGFGFGTTPQQFGSITSGTSFGGFAGASGFPGKPSEMGSSNQQPAVQTANANKNAEMYKPLYAVPATFTPPPVQQPTKSDAKPAKPTVVANKINLNSGELDEVVKKMIVIQIEAFETELKQIRQQSKQLLENIGSPVEIKPYTKQLNDLQEIIEQANDHEFEQDVQSLRHAMNESYAMLAECRTKLDLYNNPNLTRLSTVSTSDPTSRRQFAKLQAYVAANKNQLSQLNQLIESQWSQYQDVVRRNSKNQMHIPCLDGIYQRMSKLKDLLARQRAKMNFIKTKLKQKGLNYQPPSELDVTTKAVGALTKNQSTMESLADSVLSMSLSQVVAQTHAKLSDEKLKALRNFTKQQQQIPIIKPKRPDRVDLKSEVILETKLETERKQKEIVKKLQQQQHQQQQLQVQQQQQQQQYIQQQQQQYMVNKTPINLQQKSQPNTNYQTSLQQQLLRSQATMVQTQQQQQPVIAKPTASKPSMVISQQPVFITPTSSTSATISFGGNSSFVKTSQSVSITKTEEVSKTTASSTPFTGGFGMPQQAGGHNFVQPKPLQATTSVSNESKENLPLTTPISFSAKVIGGNDTKTFVNLGNKTNTTNNNMLQPPISQGFAGTTSTSGFSAFATTKPVVAAKGTQDKNENKQPDEAGKTAATVAIASTASATTPFAGFGSTTKSTVSSTAATASSPFSTPLIGSNSSSNNTPVSTPFSGQPFASSAFSFTAATTTPSTASSAVENNTNKAVTSTAQSTAAGVKTTEVKAATTSSTTATPTTAATPTSSAPLNLVTSKAPAAPNVTVTSSGLPAPKPGAAAPTSCSTPTPTAATDPTDSLFGSLNICKPTPKVAGDTNKSGNIFSGFATSAPVVTPSSFAFATASGAGDGAKSFFSSTTTTTASAPSTEFSFTAAAKTPASTADNVFGKPSTTATATTATADSTTITTTTTTVASSVVSSTPSTAPASAPAPAPATSSFPFAATATSSASTGGSLFGALSLTASATGTTTNTTPTTTSPGSSIFGGGASVFGQPTTVAVTSTTTSLFGGGAAVASSAPSLFGSTAPAATTAATPGSGSIFAAAATPQSAGSIFGGIPKPEQSVFGSAGTAPQPAATGLFAAAAANTNPPAASGGSIFGGASSTGFGSSTAGGSIFGGGSTSTSPFAANTAANSSGSIFAAAAAATKPPESGGNLFGSPTQQSAASGGSIFGKSTFGGMATTQPAGNIFGASTTQSPTSGGFGASGGSIFGGGSAMSNTGTSGGSIFGAAAAGTAPAFASTTSTTGGFGAFSQPTTTVPFASPTAGGGFAASAAAPFGSPQQQSAFAKPVFGGPATFGSPTPAFGAQPTFGGAPTFGSPKGFGSFAATSPASPCFGGPAQASPAPKGNIFETLGTQDSGLSFGNLAHTAQAPQPKPTFGGVSFLNYRS